MIKRIRQEDLKRLAVAGKVKAKGSPPKKKAPPAKAPDHGAILSKMATLLQENSVQQRNVLESMKALMEREPTSAATLRQLIEALQSIQPPPVITPKPWSGQLRFEIERDGTGVMRAVNVTRGPSKILNS
jgi:hypothetical protein